MGVRLQSDTRMNRQRKRKLAEQELEAEAEGLQFSQPAIPTGATQMQHEQLDPAASQFLGPPSIELPPIGESYSSSGSSSSSSNSSNDNDDAALLFSSTGHFSPESEEVEDALAISEVVLDVGSTVS